MAYRIEKLKQKPRDNYGNIVWDGETIPQDAIDDMRASAPEGTEEISITLDESYQDERYMKIVGVFE